MNDKFKDVDERFARDYFLICSDVRCSDGGNLYIKILDFFHSEISQAEKKARIEGARALAEKAIAWIEHNEHTEGHESNTQMIKYALSELEKEVSK